MKCVTLIAAGIIVASTAASRAEGIDTMADCQKFVAAWQEIYNKGDAAALASLYAKQATFSDSFWTATSQPAIEQGFKAEMIGLKFTSIECDRSSRIDSLGYSGGTFSAVAKGPDGKDMQSSGHWLAATRFSDGRYTIINHIANMQLPRAAAATH